MIHSVDRWISGSLAVLLLIKSAHLGEAGLVAVFDHADEVGGSGRHKLGPECPHDRIQQQSTVGKNHNNTVVANNTFGLIEKLMDFTYNAPYVLEVLSLNSFNKLMQMKKIFFFVSGSLTALFS